MASDVQPTRAGADNAKPRIIVAGVGLVTPLGLGAWETFSALRSGRSITDRARHLPPDVDPVELVRAVGTVGEAQHTAADPTVELAERAAREAAAEAGVTPRGLPAFIATSKGAIGRMIAAADAIRHERRRARMHAHEDALRAVTLGPHGYINHHLTDRLGVDIRGHTVAACASSLIALDRARRFLLHAPDAPREALVITAEAALHPLLIHSYRRLGVLAPLTREGYRERPLDARRSGFVLAEAGAAVLLRRLEPSEPTPRHAVALSHTATAADPYDLIRPNPAMDAVRHLAATVPQREGALTLHPHAPGTAGHDEHELTALREVMRVGGESPCYAVKGALGHTLGAAGLVSVVVASLCARARQLPPMPWLEKPIESCSDERMRMVRSLEAGSMHAVFAAGFAGHAGVAVLGHPG